MNLFKVRFTGILLFVLAIILLGCASPYEKKVQAINNGEVSQYELAQIANTSYADENIRTLAVRKITDQTLLARIAINSNNYGDNYLVGKAAAQEITDQTLLAKIALNSKNYLVGQAAAQKITDQTLLTKIAFESKDHDLREAAMAKLTDKSVLCKHVSVGRMVTIRPPFLFLTMAPTKCEIIAVSREAGTATIKCPEIAVSGGSDCHAPYPGAPLICSHKEADHPYTGSVDCVDIPRSK